MLDGLTEEQYKEFSIDPRTNLRYYPNDLYFLVFSIFGFFLFRLIATILFYRPLANFLKCSKTIKKGETVSEYDKFLENCYYSTVYPIFAIYEIFILHDADYIFTATQTVPHFEVITHIRYLYIIELGFYVQLIINALFIDIKTSDFIELFVHHNITIILILFSYLFSYHRAGLLFLALHDIVDVFLY